MSGDGSRPVTAVFSVAGSSHLRDTRAARTITAVTRPVVAGMAKICKTCMAGDDAACGFAGTVKSRNRVKSLVTVASGFPVPVRPLTRWPAVWFIFRHMSDSLEKLYQAVIAAKDLDPS